MQKSTLIAGLGVGTFTLALATFFCGVLLLLHGPVLAGAGTTFAGLAYTVVGICGAASIVIFIAADAIVERRIAAAGPAALVTRAVRAACAWCFGIVGVAMMGLVGEWALLGVPVLGLAAMGVQFPRGPHISSDHARDNAARPDRR